jgi:DNA-binding IclR family transcriptional regulator
LSAGTAAGYDRIIATLGHLATGRHSTGWGVRELAEVLGESLSGVNRVLLALTDLGLAERTGAGNYRAGPA